MKNSSFLTTITQPHPHRTSVHTHMQSTAYHYNSIIKAKSQIDNSKPNQNNCLNAVSNKRSKNINSERIAQNRKILKTLVDIQRNYSLYGVKNQTETTQYDKTNISLFGKTRRKSLQPRTNPFNNGKTLKNPFLEKMQKLKISEQNLKLFEKINSMPSQISNKKTLKQWNSRLDYLSHFLQSGREKQTCETLKNQFFSTYVKMRESHNLEGSTMRLQPSELIKNPELKSLSSSKRLTDKQSDMSIKQSIRIKHKKKKNGTWRRPDTQADDKPEANKFYTQNSQEYRQGIQ